MVRVPGQGAVFVPTFDTPFSAPRARRRSLSPRGAVAAGIVAFGAHILSCRDGSHFGCFGYDRRSPEGFPPVVELFRYLQQLV